jgi:FkbM family methyltransferase
MSTTVIRKRDQHDEDIEIIFENLKDIQKKGVIHLGAHKGEEVDFYFRNHIKNIILVEANPELYKDLLDIKFKNKVNIYNYAISDNSGYLDFYVHESNNGIESSSLFKMDKFDKIVTSLKTSKKIKVNAITIDSFIEKENINLNDYNILISDIQGADYFALMGASHTLSKIDAVIVEGQFIELYENFISIDKIDELMSLNGFDKILVIEHELYQGENYFPAWGEILYKKKK